MPARLTELGADPASGFPPVDRALREPDGLLAWGGDLTPRRLLSAYAHGCFPWSSEGEPLLWWSPDPRMVLATADVHVGRRLRRWLRDCTWTATSDRAFGAIIGHCESMPRPGQDGTWITPDMQAAYARLHELGWAHSIEVWADDDLAGGLYGVAIGRMFFAESMVSLASGGSKVALLALCRTLSAWGWPWIDCQVDSPHLRTLGASPLPRERFIAASRLLCAHGPEAGAWTERFGVLEARALAVPPSVMG